MPQPPPRQDDPVQRGEGGGNRHCHPSHWPHFAMGYFPLLYSKLGAIGDRFGEELEDDCTTSACVSGFN